MLGPQILGSLHSDYPFPVKALYGLGPTIVVMGLSSTSCHCCSLRAFVKDEDALTSQESDQKSVYFFFSKTDVDMLNVDRSATVLVICWQLSWKVSPKTGGIWMHYQEWIRLPCFRPRSWDWDLQSALWQPTRYFARLLLFLFLFPTWECVCLPLPVMCLPSVLPVLYLSAWTFHSYLCLVPIQFIIYLLSIHYVLCHVLKLGNLFWAKLANYKIGLL